MRVPKSIVQKLLKEKNLSMNRKTIGKRRAWVVSDGRAFPSLTSAYLFYAPKDNTNAIGALLEKFKEEQ